MKVAAPQQFEVLLQEPMYIPTYKMASPNHGGFVIILPPLRCGVAKVFRVDDLAARLLLVDSNDSRGRHLEGGGEVVHT